MILRIHIKHEEGKFVVTDLFSVSGEIDFSLFENLLSRIKFYIADEKNYFLLASRGSLLAFRINQTPYKYEFELLDNADGKVPEETIIRSVEKIVGMPLNLMLTKTRKHKYFKPKVVLLSALRYFGKATVYSIEDNYGVDHCTTIHATNKACPSFITINDDFICHSIQRLAEEFNDARFMDAARLGKYN